MNLEKTYTIFKDDYGKYKIGLNHKTIDGKVEYSMFPVKFKKNIQLENKTKIKIENYWLDFYNWEYNNKKGTTFYIFINEFKTIDEQIEPTKKVLEKESKDDNMQIYEDFGNEIELSEDSLPF